MKVLFVPMLEGGPAHLLPLLALDKMLKHTSAETAFLVPRKQQQVLRQGGVNVLDIDHVGFRSEVPAYKRFGPDVVVDDAGMTTGAATLLTGTPRVAIQRTGMFPGGAPRNEKHGHSMEISAEDLRRKWAGLAHLGLPEPKAFSDLFRAECKIVPGLPSIEVLPPPLQDDPTYCFSGPLLMDDFLIDRLGGGGRWAGVNPGDSKNFAPLQKFFDRNRRRRRLYVTFGTVAQPTREMYDCLKFLLGNDAAVVSSIRLDDLTTVQRELFFYAPYLPMHFVCSNIDLMVHHCGSGTYQYPLIHEVPSIIVGTQCHDRDDVGMRLAELGAAVYLPGPGENETFVGDFKRAVEQYFAGEGGFMAEKKKSLAALNEEVKRTAEAFDLEAVLVKAAHLSAERRHPPH
ncbi:MAG TPA: nucleotide disphospho-sugar-binding domain-containing protein [Pyrinomonadaceae bacterium]|nr:nucleotide disphospho-sugar-binding domain-containing protein [Pyrinomonadaceae bacterium]